MRSPSTTSVSSSPPPPRPLVPDPQPGQPLVADLPAESPVRIYAAAQIAKLESLGFTGEVRGTPNEDGIATLPSVSDHEQPRYLPGATKG